MGRLISKPNPNDLNSICDAIAKLDNKLNTAAKPVFAGMGVTDLTALRLVATDASQVFTSADLASWVAGTSNQVSVADDGDGTITLSTPQDIHTGATPTFAGLLSTGVVQATDFAKTGWPKTPGVTLSFSYPTFTVTDGGSAYYYINGVKYTLNGNKTVDITDTEGLWYIYFDGATLTASQTPWVIEDDDKVLVAYLYWDATNSKEILLGYELHTFLMSGATHSRLHNAGGAAWGNGLLVSDTGSETINVGIGSMRDEDIEIDITDGDGGGLFEQVLSPAELPIYYRDGANNWRIYETTDKANTTDLGYVNGSNDLKYNKLNGTWATATVGTNNYVAYFVVATNDQTEPVALIMGQRADNKLSEAKANNIFSSLNLAGLPFQELIVLARLILKDTGSGVYYTLEEVVDLRSFNAEGNVTSPLIISHAGLSQLAWSESGHYFDAAVDFNAQDVSNMGTLSCGVITQSGTTLDNTYQPLDAGLTSLAALSYSSASFIKMTGTDTFALRTIAQTADDLESSIDHDNLANVHQGVTTTDRVQFASLGIGVAGEPPTKRMIYAYNTALSTNTLFYIMHGEVTKTAGGTDTNDHMRGLYTRITINDTGATHGELSALDSVAKLVDGEVGASGTSRVIMGVRAQAEQNGGIVWGSVYGIFNVVSQSGGTIKQNVYGNFVSMSLNGTIDGTSYGIYLTETGSPDYGFYQDGTAQNVFGGDITAANYTAANLFTACATSAGSLDFSSDVTLTVAETETTTNYHTDARAASWLAANHETTYTHTDIASNTTHRETTSGNPHSVTPTELGLVIGTDVQAHGDILDDFNTLGAATSDGQFIVATGAGALAWESGSTVRNSLDLGTADRVQFGTVGIGIAGEPANKTLLYTSNTALNTPYTFYAMRSNIVKTAGGTNTSDHFYGLYNRMTINDNGASHGSLHGLYSVAVLTDGILGASGTVRSIYGALCITEPTGGTIWGDAYASYNRIVQGAGNTIKQNIYGAHISLSIGGTVDGTSYGIYLDDGGADYGFYQNGTAQNLFGGTLKIKESAAANGDTAAYGQLWVKNDSPNVLMFTDDNGTDYTVDLTPV